MKEVLKLLIPEDPPLIFQLFPHFESIHGKMVKRKKKEMSIDGDCRKI
ncbi:MAG TPA: hypothetical protein VK120_04420 [Sporosarcina sp.]|nr:hypothetical protein [Sporosarcina sp.]